MTDDEILSEDDVLERFSARVEQEERRKEAEQAFINLLIQQTHDAGAFHNCPDQDGLYHIVELALRLALTCHKQEGRGPVNGYGIASKFIQAVRRHVENHERDKRANERYAEQKKLLPPRPEPEPREAIKPCHGCGSDKLTICARPTFRSQATPGRIVRCRTCGRKAEFDTPERGPDVRASRDARDRSGVAQWNRSTVADMQPMPGRD
jgi:hypothetical protein